MYYYYLSNTQTSQFHVWCYTSDVCFLKFELIITNDNILIINKISIFSILHNVSMS
jgi:hypothetical protein